MGAFGHSVHLGIGVLRTLVPSSHLGALAANPALRFPKAFSRGRIHSTSRQWLNMIYSTSTRTNLKSYLQFTCPFAVVSCAGIQGPRSQLHALNTAFTNRELDLFSTPLNHKNPEWIQMPLPDRLLSSLNRASYGI